MPADWEIAYNHYVNRKGFQMPNTLALLTKNRPEGYAFHWGLGTLTHCTDNI